MNDYDALVGKKVIVTGGAGFVGSHICEELVARTPKSALRQGRSRALP